MKKPPPSVEARHEATKRALIAGRLCLICGKPTGSGRRMLCGKSACREARRRQREQAQDSGVYEAAHY